MLDYQKKLLSEILSKTQNNTNSIKSSENNEKTVKSPLKGFKREIGIFDENGGSEMTEKGKKEVRQVYFNDLEKAKEFIWASFGYDVKVKDVSYDEGPCVYVVTIKGRWVELEKFSRDFDTWVVKNDRKRDQQTHFELRRRTGALANALANREGLVAYLMQNCHFGDDEIADIENLVDPIIIDLVHELTKDRPGPTGAMLDAYLKMVGEIHESD